MSPTARPFPLCYHAGRVRPLAEAVLPVGSLAVRYGLSAFEGVRLYLPEPAAAGDHARPLALDRHLARLAATVAMLGMPAAASEEAREAIAALLAAQAVHEDAYLRVAVGPGNSGPLGTPPRPCVTVTVSAFAAGTMLARPRRLRVTVSARRRAPSASLPYELKVAGAYLTGHLALAEARARGFDTCILRGPGGQLCEAPTAALVVVRGGEVASAAKASGCLPSITVALLLEQARALGLRPRRRRLDAAALAAADEAFLAGTAVEIAPIGEVDGQSLPEGGKVAEALARALWAYARGPSR